MRRDKIWRIPVIVVVSSLLFTMLSAMTILSWQLETADVHGNRALFSIFSDAFKVGLGAFIGVLSQWATAVFGPRDTGTRPGESERPAGQGKADD